MYSIEFSRSAIKDLKGISNQAARQIKNALEKLAIDPFSTSNVKKMQGEDGYRMRVGDYRIIYLLKQEIRIVNVVKIGKRGDVYKH